MMQQHRATSGIAVPGNAKEDVALRIIVDLKQGVIGILLGGALSVEFGWSRFSPPRLQPAE